MTFNETVADNMARQAMHEANAALTITHAIEYLLFHEDRLNLDQADLEASHVLAALLGLLV